MRHRAESAALSEAPAWVARKKEQAPSLQGRSLSLWQLRADDGIRTRDIHLGKVVL